MTVTAHCSEPDCIRPIYATGKCKPCYERIRRAVRLGPPAAERRCANPDCGELMVNRAHRDAMYCSDKCKNACRPLREGQHAPAWRLGLTCDRLGCDKPVPKGRERFCSKECMAKGKAIERTESRRETARAAAEMRSPCANPKCGGPIPLERFAGAIYCSPKCKKDVNDARWRARSPHYNREYNYGITQQKWESKLTEQGYRCVICRRDDWPGPGPNNDGRPHAEHDHKTKKFRGVSCGRDNLMLGHADDDPLRLIAAARYLLTAKASPDGLGQHCDDLDLLGDALLALAGGDPAMLRAADTYLESARDNST